MVDTSSDMREEVAAAEENINNDLAAVLEEDGVDYRIILAELDDPQGDTGTVSGAAQYPGGYGKIAPENVDPEQFRYVVRSILGVAGKAGGLPWVSSDPVQNSICTPGSEDAGRTYQQLSILTDGLRFPLCQVNDADPDNDDYNLIFKAIAENVKTETILPCSFSPADRDPGLPPLNYEGAKLIYRPGDTGELELFNEVQDTSLCGTTDNAFYKVGSDTFRPYRRRRVRPQ